MSILSVFFRGFLLFLPGLVIPLLNLISSNLLVLFLQLILIYPGMNFVQSMQLRSVCEIVQSNNVVLSGGRGGREKVRGTHYSKTCTLCIMDFLLNDCRTWWQQGAFKRGPPALGKLNRGDGRANVAKILRFFCKTPASLHWQYVYQLSTSTPERDDTNSSVNMQIDYLVKSI